LLVSQFWKRYKILTRGKDVAVSITTL